MLDNIYYPFHMKVNKRLLAFFGKEEVVVGEGIHKEVSVRIFIGIVSTEVLAREMVP